MTSLRQLTRNPNESQLQAAIVQGLRMAGYVVIETGRPQRQVRCVSCGTFFSPRSGTQNSVGCPDLLVARPGAGFRGWMGLELKVPAIHTLLGNAPGGRLRPEQRVLRDMGLVTIITSLDEALSALEAC